MSGASNIRAGRAFVELGIDDRMTRGLKQAERHLKDFAAAARTIGQSMQGLGLRVGAAGTAIVGAMTAAAKSYGAAGSALVEMAARTGYSVEALSELESALLQNGVSLDGLEVATKRMQRTLVDAASGSESAAEAISALGVSAEELLELGPEEQLDAMADALASIANPAVRTAMALEIFGRQGTSLIPLLAGGSKGLHELRSAAVAAGQSIGTDAAVAADELDDSFADLWLTVKRLAFAVGAQVAPEFREWVALSKDVVMGAIDWANANGDFLRGVLAIGGAAIVAGGALVGLGTAVGVVGSALEGFLGIFDAFRWISGAVGSLASLGMGALATLLNPLNLLVAGFAGLAGWLAYTSIEWSDLGDSISAFASGAWADLQDTTGSIFDDAKDAWDSIVRSVGAGELEGAFRVAAAAMKVVWAELVAYIMRQFGMAKQEVEGWLKRSGVSGWWSDVEDGAGMVGEAASNVSNLFAADANGSGPQAGIPAPRAGQASKGGDSWSLWGMLDSEDTAIASGLIDPKSVLGPDLNAAAWMTPWGFLPRLGLAFMDDVFSGGDDAYQKKLMAARDAAYLDQSALTERGFQEGMSQAQIDVLAGRYGRVDVPTDALTEFLADVEAARAKTLGAAPSTITTNTSAENLTESERAQRAADQGILAAKQELADAIKAAGTAVENREQSMLLFGYGPEMVGPPRPPAGILDKPDWLGGTGRGIFNPAAIQSLAEPANDLREIKKHTKSTAEGIGNLVDAARNGRPVVYGD